MSSGDNNNDLPPLKVGDKCWCITHYIAVEATVNEITQWPGPDGSTEYWLDEPIGHAVLAGEICYSKEEAVYNLREDTCDRLDGFEQELSEYIDPVEIDECHKRREKVRTGTLTRFRDGAISFVRSTHVKAGATPDQLKEIDDWITSLPVKEHLKEWFNYEDIVAGRVKE